MTPLSLWPVLFHVGNKASLSVMEAWAPEDDISCVESSLGQQLGRTRPPALQGNLTGLEEKGPAPGQEGDRRGTGGDLGERAISGAPDNAWLSTARGSVLAPRLAGWRGQGRCVDQMVPNCSPGAGEAGVRGRMWRRPAGGLPPSPLNTRGQSYMHATHSYRFTLENHTRTHTLTCSQQSHENTHTPPQLPTHTHSHRHKPSPAFIPCSSTLTPSHTHKSTCRLFMETLTHAYSPTLIHTLTPKQLRSDLPSPVQLFATPWTIGHQAPLSMEVSRQE